MTPLFSLRDAFTEYAGFLAAYTTLGAIGFRYFVSGPLHTRGTPSTRSTLDTALTRAAVIGLTGALVGVLDFAADLQGAAVERHSAMLALATGGNWINLLRTSLTLLAPLAFLLAWTRPRAGWPAAALVSVVLALRNVATGRWQSMVNPVHVFAGSMWLGTLFVLVVAGITAALRKAPDGERGPLVADLVARFSPLALWAAGLLAVTGLITAWRHLKYWAALWTTPYGYTLIVKLCVVACVAGLGYWNWKRVTPTLGDEAGALRIRRSASTELGVALVVLTITAVLVSLPTPKLPAP
ncbi:MAG TPA: CopD family protein [Gemmatimonadales bacterium]|nr:CopD family protein [Gemmatimonadales bacterium]